MREALEAELDHDKLSQNREQSREERGAVNAELGDVLDELDNEEDGW